MAAATSHKKNVIWHGYKINIRRPGGLKKLKFHLTCSLDLTT